MTNAKITLALTTALILAAANAASATTFHPVQQFQAQPEGPQQVEICIVEGANICPPEDLDIVFPCITTGMLAGQTCPELPDHAPRRQVLTIGR